MYGVIYVNVGAWSRIWRFHLFIARSVITAAKCGMNCFLSYNFILDIILLIFLVVVLARAWVLRKRLSSIRRLALVLPELASLGLRQE